MPFVDVDSRWKIGAADARALNIEPGNPTWDRKWEQNLGVCVGGVGEGDSGRVSLLRYLQAFSLPHLTPSCLPGLKIILEGNIFLMLFWRTLRKKIGFEKFRAMLLKVCFLQLQPDKMLGKNEPAIN